MHLSHCISFYQQQLQTAVLFAILFVRCVRTVQLAQLRRETGVTDRGHRPPMKLPCDVVYVSTDGSPVCGPQVIVGGAMKCGTNAVGQLLALHPLARFNLCDARSLPAARCNTSTHQGNTNNDLWEIHYFSSAMPELSYINKDKRKWYASMIAHTDGINNFTVDKSPSYMEALTYPKLPNDVKALLPNAKIVFVVCDPAERYYSEFNHIQHWCPECWSEVWTRRGMRAPETFPDFVNALLPGSRFCSGPECESWRAEVVAKGEYVQLLQRWKDTYGREFEDKILVLNMETTDEQKASRIMEHVGLPQDEYPWSSLPLDENKRFASSTPRTTAWQWYPGAMSVLSNLYRSYNEELAAFTGQTYPLGWSSAPPASDGQAAGTGTADEPKTFVEGRLEDQERPKLGQYPEDFMEWPDFQSKVDYVDSLFFR